MASRLEDQLSMKIWNDIHKKKVTATDEAPKKAKKKVKAKDS